MIIYDPLLLISWWLNKSPLMTPNRRPPKPNSFRRFRWALGHAIAGQDHKLIIDLDGFVHGGEVLDAKPLE